MCSEVFEHPKHIAMHVVRRKFSRNSEAFASELRENLEEMESVSEWLIIYIMFSDISLIYLELNQYQLNSSYLYISLMYLCSNETGSCDSFRIRKRLLYM